MAASFFWLASRALSRWLPRAMVFDDERVDSFDASALDCSFGRKGVSRLAGACGEPVDWMGMWKTDFEGEPGSKDREGCLSATCCQVVAGEAVHATFLGASGGGVC